jgi:hypothetical protein
MLGSWSAKPRYSSAVSLATYSWRAIGVFIAASLVISNTGDHAAKRGS